MASTVQHQILRVCRRATSLSLALAIVLAAAVVATSSASAQTFTVLYSFTGGADGAVPFADLVRDEAGNLYGTTAYGGDFTSFPDGSGVVFKLDPNGKETVLHAFTGKPDGAQPVAGLIRDQSGNLYGTTGLGGVYDDGAVFQLDPNGNETVLYSFTGGADGGLPSAGLIRDKAGNLYGTTFEGGVTGGTCGDLGCGVVFKLDPTGKLTVLHSFTGGTDGDAPTAELIRDNQGNLYGTTFGGGDLNDDGTVFKLDPNGNETVLYRFGGADGSRPRDGLVRDKAGNLYATTWFGGVHGYGTVFRLDTSGKETVLYSFAGPPRDGSQPLGGLARDKMGNLYGATSKAGGGSGGMVFKLDKTGKLTALHRFRSGADGATSNAALIADPAGNLYGTTLNGGHFSPPCATFGCGVVFKITP